MRQPYNLHQRGNAPLVVKQRKPLPHFRQQDGGGATHGVRATKSIGESHLCAEDLECGVGGWSSQYVGRCG